MALAVCLLFDTRSDRLIRELWDRLESFGVGTLASHTHGQHRPHLSYAVLRDWDLTAVTRAMERLPEGEPPALTCQGSLLFPRGRVALAPALTADIAARQERVTEALGHTGADLHRHYLRGRWVPHVSIATRARRDQLSQVVTAIADVLPLELWAERAALIDSSTGEQWPLPGLP